MKITQLKNIDSEKIEKHSIKNSEIDKYSLINPKMECKKYLYISKYLEIKNYQTKFKASFGFYNTESKIQYKKLNPFLFAWVCRQRNKLKKKMQEQSKIENAINRIPKNQYILKSQYNNFIDNFKKIRQWALQNLKVIKDYDLQNLQNSEQVQNLKNEVKNGNYENLPRLTDELKLVLKEIKKIETKPGLTWLGLKKWKNMIAIFYPEFCEIDMMVWNVTAYILLLQFLNEFYSEIYREGKGGKNRGNSGKYFAVIEKFYDLWDKFDLKF